MPRRDEPTDALLAVGGDRVARKQRNGAQLERSGHYAVKQHQREQRRAGLGLCIGLEAGQFQQRKGDADGQGQGQLGGDAP